MGRWRQECRNDSLCQMRGAENDLGKAVGSSFYFFQCTEFTTMLSKFRNMNCDGFENVDENTLVLLQLSFLMNIHACASVLTCHET